MTLIFSLVGGLAIALIIQLLFASLGIALSLTLLDLSPKPQPATQEDRTQKNRTQKEPAQKEPAEAQSKFSLPKFSLPRFSLPVTHLVGFGIALGVSGLIFMTAFVSTDFSAIIQPRRGLIFGVIFWAIYWTLLIWLSTTTIAGIVDALFGGAIASIKQILAVLKKSPNAPEPDEDSVLQGLATELSQIIESQQALPALLASQRETLVQEISDRTQLSPTQTETILTDITPTEPEVSPPSYSTASSSSSLVSKLGSTLDLPSWQQLSQRVIDQIDFSDIEALVYQIPSLLQEKASASNSSTQAGSISSAIENEAVTKVSLSSSAEPPETTAASKAPKEQTAIDQEIQSKLISYCRYTNIDLLTPENLTAKIESQLEEHSADFEHLQVDIAAVENVLSRRQNLDRDSKRALIGVLEAAEHQKLSEPEQRSAEASTEAETETKQTESYPQKIQQALESSVQAVEWQEVLAPSLNGTGDLVSQMKTQIARYLQKQDKLSFHPVQMAKDLTHIVGHGLRSLPHPSDLPNLAELETLWDKSSWQLALEKRKDLTVDEIQEILAWGETAWKPVVKQAGIWLQSLQSQAEQLLSLVDNASLDTSLDTARETIVEQIGLAKEKLDEQATAMKAEIQTQADAARKQGAIAAWWLFIALSLSGMAAGSAGWLAVLY